MSDKVSTKNNYKFTQKYNSETYLEEIEVITSKDQLDKFFQKALTEITKVASAPGFRKGRVPTNVVMANRYNEIADRSIELLVSDALKEKGEIKPTPLDIISIISVRNISEDKESDIAITLGYLPFPEVKLPNLESIKIKKTDSKKTNKEEVEKEIENVWFSYAGQKDPNIKKEDFKKELINDEFIKESGIINDDSNIKSYEDLYTFIEDYINKTYERSSEIDWENQILSEMVKSSEFTHSEGILAKELDRRIENYLGKFKEIGVDPEEYLKKNNVNLDDLKKEWSEKADHDVKLELVLQSYGHENHIHPSEEEMQSELSKLDQNTKKMYNFDEDRLRNLVNYYYVNNKSYIDLVSKIKKQNEN